MMVEDTSICKLEDILTGLLALPLIGIYLVLTFPIYIYRWVVAHLVAPFYRPEIGNIISGLGVSLALEFYQKKELDQSTPFHFKSNIVSKFVIDGTVPFDEVQQTFQERVISKLSPNGGDLLYPELQQYPGLWMGFMFWKRESDFKLRDHFHPHQKDEMWDSSLDPEEYVSEMMEKLVNKQFPSDRSPWDMHVIYINKNQELSKKTGRGDMTVLLFCVHHSIVDGYSILNLLVKDYFNTPVSNMQLVSPKMTPESESRYETSILQVWDMTSAVLLSSIQIVADIGYIFSVRRFLWRSPWHENPDAKRKRPILTTRSKRIPMQVVKDVKNKFGVTFTSVLLSIFAKGISESFQRGKSNPSKFTIMIVQPLPNHPKELRNHATCGFLDVPAIANPALFPKGRLHLLDSCWKEQKSFVMRPFITSVLLNMLSVQLACIANIIIGRNMNFSAFLSNFPIPVVNFEFNGHKILEADFTAGTLQGVTGVAFLISSYDGGIRLGATAESGVMSRDELDELVHVATDELYELYQQSL